MTVRLYKTKQILGGFYGMYRGRLEGADDAATTAAAGVYSARSDSAPGSYAGAMLAHEQTEGASRERRRDDAKRRRQKQVVQTLDAVRPPRA